MSELSVADWAKLLATIPAIIAAWKLPALWNWIKMKYAAATAAAVIAQLNPALAAMQSSIDEVRYQVFPNGGGSMSDTVNRVLDSAVKTEGNVVLLRDTMRAHQDSDERQVHFETEPDGRMSWVSYTMQRWCAKSLSEVSRHGWFNCVAHEDRELVRTEWARSIDEQREFNLRFKMIGTDRSDLFCVEARAKPLLVNGVIQNWVGVIRRIESAKP